jgi:hypothetical protein
MFAQGHAKEGEDVWMFEMLPHDGLPAKPLQISRSSLSDKRIDGRDTYTEDGIKTVGDVHS